MKLVTFSSVLGLAATLFVVSSAHAQASSAETEAVLPSNWAQEEVEPLSPQGATLISLRVTGSALRPRESADGTQVSTSGGCIYNAGGSAFGILNAPIYLPQGAVVDTLRMYYYDTSASTSFGWFTAYDLYGAIAFEWSVSSSGSSGNSFSDSALIDHTIDHSIYSYVVNWRPQVAGSTMQLCGFRIFYLPADVFADGFETGDSSRWTTTVP